MTILFGVLTWKHEQLIEGLLRGAGYNCQRMLETDRESRTSLFAISTKTGHWPQFVFVSRLSIIFSGIIVSGWKRVQSRTYRREPLPRANRRQDQGESYARNYFQTRPCLPWS